MRHDVVEQIGGGVGFIDVRRVNVTGYHGEQFDVAFSERAGQRGAVAYGDVVVGAVFYKGGFGHREVP